MRREMLFIVAAGWCFLLGGCFGTMRDYQPRDKVGKEIKETLLRFEAAYNKGDIKEALACFHQEAVLEVDHNGPFPVGEAVGREEIHEVMKTAMSLSPKMGLGEPTIFLTLDTGQKAVLEVVSEFGSQTLVAKFSMIKETNGWVIKKIVFY